MPNEADSKETAVVASLEGQVRALRAQVTQRERTLAMLNRRLMMLERGDIEHGPIPGEFGFIEDEVATLRIENDYLRREVAALRGTKVFRWSSSARGLYARARHLG